MSRSSWPHGLEVLGISAGDHGTDRDLVSTMDGARRGGLRVLILREPQLAERATVTLARRLSPGLGSGLVVHGRNPWSVELAVSGGWGLHLPSDVSPMGLRSRIRGLFGASCHDEAELERAASAGCDYALISPVFSPRSKPGDRRSTLQLRGLADLASRSALPVVALGGIDSERTGPCIRAGAAAVATIGGLFPPGATPEEVEHLARDMVRAGTVARLGLS